MRFIFNKDNLSKLSTAVRPVIQGDKMTGVEKVEVPEQYTVYDAGPLSVVGLGLYVGVRRKTFVLQTRIGSKVTRVTLGEYPRLNVNTGDPLTDVRLIANNVRFAMKRGTDIQELRSEERKIVATTLGDVLRTYLHQYRHGKDPRQNSIKAIEAAIRRLDQWLGKSLRSIGSNTVDEIWQEITKGGKKNITAAEQTLMWCRAAFNVHIERQQADRNRASFDGELLVNPFNIARRKMRTRRQLEDAYHDNNVRNPVDNTPERLGAWLEALWAKRRHNRDAVDYMMLTLLLGARRSETAQLVWRDRLLAKGFEEGDYSVLTLPHGQEHGQVTFRRTKGGFIHSVPLGRFATWLMRQRYEDSHDSLYVFPASSKNPATKSPYYNSPREFVASLRATLEKQSIRKAWDARVATYAAKGQQPSEKFEAFAAQYVKGEWKFTMHDLRRTFCTVAVNIEGMPYAVVQQLMNHSQMGNVTARYGKPTQEALRKHMQQLEDELLKYATALPQIQMEG